MECKQILLCLGVPVGAHKPGTSKWRHHPAVLMWEGHEFQLAGYGLTMCDEWRRRGYNDSLRTQFIHAMRHVRRTGGITSPPPWLGKRSIHASHRSNLLRKDAGHYSQFGWIEPDNLPYVWPVVHTEST